MALSKKDGTKCGEIQLSIRILRDEINKANIKKMVEKLFHLTISKDEIINGNHYCHIITLLSSFLPSSLFGDDNDHENDVNDNNCSIMKKSQNRNLVPKIS